MSFDKMIKDFKDTIELQSFAEAQYKTILDLNKKINQVQEEKKQLELLLQNSVPMLEGQKKEFLGYDSSTPNEEIISTVQLGKLKEISFVRELTLEESKRVEIFSKILSSLKSKEQKPKDNGLEEVSTAELIRLVPFEQKK